MPVRQFICCVLGHIDHGKTSILDRIRGTAVNSREPGGITQHVGASEVPMSVIKEVCGPLLKNLKNDLMLPGLLFIDTPGHSVFSSLRERGGGIADMAVLVIDCMNPLQPQAIESIEILKKNKVPFIIAFNKIDTIEGWVKGQGKFILDSIKNQSIPTQTMIEERLYALVNELSQQGFNSDRFDRVSDFAKEVSIIPTSARTGEGIPELLMVLTGLAQKYLGKELEITFEMPGQGSVLEVKEVKGLGTTMDVIIYDGTLIDGDLLVIGGIDKPIRSKARVLLKPAPLQEMREKGEFIKVKNVIAASGVKISGPGLDQVTPGVPLIACRNEAQVSDALIKVQESIKKIIFNTSKEGLILKADSLGSLEALTTLFSEHPVKKAVIGPVNKADVIEAISVRESKPELGVIITFNAGILPEAEEIIKDSGINVFSEKIIYSLKEKYEAYRDKVQIEIKRQALAGVILPVKLQVIKGLVFRASSPAIVGIEVMNGTLKAGQPLISESGKQVGFVKALRKEEEVLSQAVKGANIAVSIDGGIIGRNFNDDSVLFSDVSEQDFHKLKGELKKYLTPDEIEAMRELLAIRRKDNPMWGF